MKPRDDFCRHRGAHHQAVEEIDGGGAHTPPAHERRLWGAALGGSENMLYLCMDNENILN